MPHGARAPGRETSRHADGREAVGTLIEGVEAVEGGTVRWSFSR